MKTRTILAAMATAQRGPTSCACYNTSGGSCCVLERTNRRTISTSQKPHRDTYCGLVDERCAIVALHCWKSEPIRTWRPSAATIGRAGNQSQSEHGGRVLQQSEPIRTWRPSAATIGRAWTCWSSAMHMADTCDRPLPSEDRVPPRPTWTTDLYLRQAITVRRSSPPTTNVDRKSTR